MRDGRNQPWSELSSWQNWLECVRFPGQYVVQATTHGWGGIRVRVRKMTYNYILYCNVTKCIEGRQSVLQDVYQRADSYIGLGLGLSRAFVCCLPAASTQWHAAWNTNSLSRGFESRESSNFFVKFQLFSMFILLSGTLPVYWVLLISITENPNPSPNPKPNPNPNPNLTLTEQHLVQAEETLLTRYLMHCKEQHPGNWNLALLASSVKQCMLQFF